MLIVQETLCIRVVSYDPGKLPRVEETAGRDENGSGKEYLPGKREREIQTKIMTKQLDIYDVIRELGGSCGQRDEYHPKI